MALRPKRKAHLLTSSLLPWDAPVGLSEWESCRNTLSPVLQYVWVCHDSWFGAHVSWTQSSEWMKAKKKKHYISACPWQEVTEQNTKCHTSTCGMHNRKRDTAAVNQNIASCCSLLAVKLYYTLIYSFEGQFTPTSMIHILLLCVVLSSHLYCFGVSCRFVEMPTISSI